MTAAAPPKFSWATLRTNAVASVKADSLPKSIELPALPHVVTEFVEKSSQPDFEIPVLAKIVEKDTALTIELLKQVNSAAFTLTSPVRCVRDAIARLGMNNARNHLLAAGMKGATRAMKSKLVNQRNFWNESLQRGLFSKEVARRLGLDTGLAFLAGLLQDYMLPVLTNHFDREYVQYLDMDHREGRDLVDWERDTFGWDHAMVGAYYASHWKFPDDLLCAIFFHHSLQATLEETEPEFFKLFPVALSGMLPDQLRQMRNGFRELIRVNRQCEAIGLDDVCRFVDDEQMRLAEGYEIPNHLTSVLAETRRIMGEA